MDPILNLLFQHSSALQSSWSKGPWGPLNIWTSWASPLDLTSSPFSQDGFYGNIGLLLFLKIGKISIDFHYFDNQNFTIFGGSVDNFGRIGHNVG